MTRPAPGDVVDNLAQTCFAVMAVLNQAATAHDLSLTQLRMLGILRDRQPKMAELATRLGLDRSSVSGLIDRAVSRGLVRRETDDQDGRAVQVNLTAAGRRLARELTAEVGLMIAPMTDRLTAADQKRLSALLEQLQP